MPPDASAWRGCKTAKCSEGLHHVYTEVGQCRPPSLQRLAVLKARLQATRERREGPHKRWACAFDEARLPRGRGGRARAPQIRRGRRRPMKIDQRSAAHDRTPRYEFSPKVLIRLRKSPERTSTMIKRSSTYLALALVGGLAPAIVGPSSSVQAQTYDGPMLPHVGLEVTTSFDNAFGPDSGSFSKFTAVRASLPSIIRSHAEC
jgi:hypothetical protein